MNSPELKKNTFSLEERFRQEQEFSSDASEETTKRPTLKLSPEEIKQASSEKKVDPRPTVKIPVEELTRHQEEEKKRYQEAQTPKSKEEYEKNQYLKELLENPYIEPFYIGNALLQEGQDFFIFEAYQDKERTQKLGILKIGKRGHELQISREIEFSRKFIAKEIEHPNILAYAKTGVTSRRSPYIFCEQLFPYPRKMMLEDAVASLCQIGKALEYLHKNRWYHRDIKPENILFAFADKKMRPKILGFKAYSKQIDPSQLLFCSPFTSAPEMLKKVRGHNIRQEIQFSKNDVFALGMTLLGFLRANPYFEVKPELKNIHDSGVLLEELILIHDHHSSAFFQKVDDILQSQQWNPYLKIQYGLQYSQRKQLIDFLSKFLKEVLHVKPEERPTATNFTKQLELCFADAFKISSEQYFLRGGTFLEEKNEASKKNKNRPLF